jgi:hypothetical protein
VSIATGTGIEMSLDAARTSAYATGALLYPLLHPHDRQRLAIRQSHFDLLNLLIPPSLIQSHTRQRRAHFEFLEARRQGSGFAGFQHFRADAAAGPAGVDEKGSDFRGVARRIEERVFAARAVVGSEQGFALAPAAAGDDGPVYFRYEIGLVGD